ncbi:MAG: aminopeptidase P N-terminal domain-containing protein [Acidobacteria bacterium]|jgi:Xaa-Pro aminopeptidase|nr:aminopeptidase P N-terminal domain-containing protein [Acidobacteriota bacterium]
MDDRIFRGGNYAAELQPPEAYRERRWRLAEAVGPGTIVVWGAGDERGYGDVGTFRQDPTFFYLTGVELPNAILVLRPQEEYEALFLPARNEALERWTGPKWGPGEETAQALGFDRVLAIEATEVEIDARRRPVESFEGRLQGWLAEPGAALWTMLPPVATTSELPPTHRFVTRLRERVPTFAVHDISDHVDRLRLIKDAGEIALMRKAIGATISGQRAAARRIGPGVTEKAIEGVVFAAFAEAGAEGLAFPSIVGTGFNATVLHYDQNVGTCAEGELVVVDVGARYGYYCGDLTRTFPVGGAFTDRQLAVYKLVLAAHDAAAAAIRPGVKIADLRKVAYETMNGSDLRDGDGEPLGRYFIHGLGHFLGLEAHDSGGEGPKLAPGMVITNEPGIYIPQEGLGVRIENDFLVTADGAENLSGDLPISPDDVLAMMKS